MQNIEIERKFLLDLEKVPYDLSKLPKKVIEQGYIIDEIRVRSVAGKDFVMTIKGETGDAAVRNEVELNISKEAFSILMARDDVHKISKSRYFVDEGDNKFEIDVYEGKLKGLAFLEVEFNSKEEAEKFQMPSWIKKEVTNDFRYRNSFLAQNSMPLE